MERVSRVRPVGATAISAGAEVLDAGPTGEKQAAVDASEKPIEASTASSEPSRDLFCETDAKGELQSLYQRNPRRMLRDWRLAGRLEQRPPEGDWRNWLIMGGRGSGKTRAGAEWVQGLASAGEHSDLRIALVAETLGDAREVMIDGMSGICRIAPRHQRPEFEITRRRLVWKNGAVAQIYSSEDPESLRGPQFHFAWCDELAK